MITPPHAVSEAVSLNAFQEEYFLRRALDDGRTGGVVMVRMPYYRGLTLSTVEAVDLVLDETPLPASRTTLTVYGNTDPFDELRQTFDDGREWGGGRSSPSRPRSPSRRTSATASGSRWLPEGTTPMGPLDQMVRADSLPRTSTP